MDHAIADGWRVRVAVVAERIARDLELEGAVSRAVFPWLFDLGLLSLGTLRVRPVLVTEVPPSEPGGIVAAIEGHRRDGSTAVLLVPRGRATSTGLPTIEIARWTPPFDDLRAEIARAIGALHHVLAPARAPGRCLVVDEATGDVFVEGVHVELSDQERLFVATIAKSQKQGQHLTTVALANNLKVGSASASDSYPRVLKKRVIEAIESSVRAAGRLLPTTKKNKLFVGVTRPGGGYEIQVSFAIV